MKKLREMLAIFAAAIVAAFGVFSIPAMTVQAETTSASSVMDDLKTDAAFSEESYPSMTLEEMKAAGQAELEIIKIGESLDDQLYIYVYQPTDATKEIEASYLKVAQTESVSSARVCPLSLVSTDGVFDKYLVGGISVMSTLSQRYYQITSIFRPFDKDLDAETGNDNTNSNIDIPVRQTWHARAAEDGKIEYAYTKDDVITITDEWHGSIRYSDGMSLLAAPFTDSHFIAFTTDYKIDELKSVEVYYQKTYIDEEFCSICATQGRRYGKTHEKIEYPAEYTLVKAEEKGGNAADHWGSHRYTWDRISTVLEFTTSNNEHLSAFAKNNLQEIIDNAEDNGAFVLRYLETPYEIDATGGSFHAGNLGLPEKAARQKGYEINDVSILKLTFETKGIPYTMGVVDSMTTSDNIPDGEYTFIEGFLAELKSWWENTTNGFLRVMRIIGLVLGAAVIVLSIFGLVKFVAWLKLMSALKRNSGGNAGNDSGDGNAGNNAGGNANGG